MFLKFFSIVINLPTYTASSVIMNLHLSHARLPKKFPHEYVQPIETTILVHIQKTKISHKF